jgi:hypothetical protein
MHVPGRLTLLVVLCALMVGAPARAATGSLYSGSGPRPGPDILYEPPATAPQVTNAGI